MFTISKGSRDLPYTPSIISGACIHMFIITTFGHDNGL